MDRKAWTWLWAAAAVVYVLLGALNLHFGELNQDEGWYLYAGRMVAEGNFPYIDFAYPQGPVMPFVYVLSQPLVDLFGVAGGRVFSALLGLFSMILVPLFAARLVPQAQKKTASFLAFCLAGINVYQSYYFTSVKTYSLCGLLLIAGFLVLTYAGGRKGWLAALVSGVLVTLAAGTRVSAGIILPVVCIVMFMAFIQVRQWQDSIDSTGAGTIIGDFAAASISPFTWLWFAVGSVLTAVIVFLPFAIKAPEALWFSLVEYHAGRNPGDLVARLAYKGGFISRMVQSFFVPIAVFVAGLVYHLVFRGRPNVRSLLNVAGATPLFRAVLLAAWLSVAAITFLHFAAPFPYEDYQVMIFPLFSVVLAVMLSGMVYDEKPDTGKSPAMAGMWLCTVLLLVCTAASFSSQVNQNWFIGPRDRIWWPLRHETPLQKLQRVGKVIKSMTRPGDLLLTQDVYLAVETGLRIPKGLEMGQFSYFPFWSREKATACHVLNREMMAGLLNTVEAPVAAFSGYGLAMGSPAVVELPQPERDVLWKLVNDRYSDFEVEPCFGQADTTLKLMRLKKEPGVR